MPAFGKTDWLVEWFDPAKGERYFSNCGHDERYARELVATLRQDGMDDVRLSARGKNRMFFVAEDV